MASPHESSGGLPLSPYDQDLWVRNTKIAMNIGSHKAAEFRSEVLRLTKHQGLVNVEVLEEAAQNEADSAAEAALAERQAGLMNDEKSKQPGIFVTGHLDYEAFEAMKELFEIDRVPYTLNVPPTSSTFTAYSLHLPEGAFECMIEEGLLDQYHLKVFGAVEFGPNEGDNFRPTGGGGHLLTGGYINEHTRIYGTIGRIEGAGGTLWQNPNINPDGSPRQQKAAAA